jgi:hypothetical protein
MEQPPGLGGMAPISHNEQDLTGGQHVFHFKQVVIDNSHDSHKSGLGKSDVTFKYPNFIQK